MIFSNSKNQSSRVLSILGLAPLVAALVLAGCSVDSKKGKTVAPGDSQDFAMEDGTNFRVDTLAVTSTAVVSWQSNGQFPAKKLFNFSACLKDFNGNAMNPDVPFTVSDANGTDRTITTFKTGCLIWAETLELNGLESENMFLLKRTITAQSIYHGKVYAQGGLNPWADNAASFVDFRTTQVPERIKVLDAKSLDNPGLRIKSAGSAPQLFIDSVNFQFLGLNYDKYEISKFLGLTVAQTYRIRMKPQIIRQTLNNEIDLKTINRGHMKVAITLLKDISGSQLDPQNVVTSTEFVGDIILGTLTADVTLKIDNLALPSLLSRTQVVVTLTPMDELADFTESTFMGPSNPGLLTATTVIPSMGNARSLALNAANLALKAASGRETLTPIQLFSQLSSVKPLDVAGTVSIGGFWGIGSKSLQVTDVLEKYMSGGLTEGEQADLAQAFCKRFFKTHALSDFCADPKMVVTMSQRDIVESVNKTPVWKGSTTKETLSLKAKVDFVNSDGWNDSIKWGWSAGLSADVSSSWPPEVGSLFGPTEVPGGTPVGGFSLPLGGSIKGSLGAKVSAGKEWFKTQTRSRVTTVSEESTRAIDVIGNSFDISAQARRCVIIGPSQQSAIIDRYKWPKTQFFYCSKTVKNVVRTESFYLLNEKVGDDSTGFSDTGRPGSSPWRMFMRGPKTYLLFKNMVQALKTNDLVLERLVDDSTIRSTMNKFPEFYTMQEYPGMFTP